MSIEAIQQEIINEFDLFENWEDRYEHLIALGKELPKLPDELKTDDRIIKGCQSTMWLDANLQDGIVSFRADSNAILPKGMAALLLRIFNHQSPEDIVHAKTEFIQEIGLQEFLSPTRANGLLAMIKQIKFYAIALKAKARQV